jgi:hypothetical protein
MSSEIPGPPPPRHSDCGGDIPLPVEPSCGIPLETVEEWALEGERMLRLGLVPPLDLSQLTPWIGVIENHVTTSCIVHHRISCEAKTHGSFFGSRFEQEKREAQNQG